MHKFLIFLIIFLTLSCNNVNTPNVKVEIERFEDIFFNSNAKNLYEVKEVLGHTDIKTTQIYAHLERKDITAKARDILERLQPNGGNHVA